LRFKQLDFVNCSRAILKTIARRLILPIEPHLDIRLIYASQSVRPMSEDDLISLLTTARKNNARDLISGLLLYCNLSFLQVLEGGSLELDRVYAKIEVDSRHKGLRLLSREVIKHRKYGEWSMGFNHVDEGRIAAEFPWYKPATQYPLVSADLVRNVAIAETMLDMHQRNLPGTPAGSRGEVLDRSFVEFVPPTEKP
jgi:hypothetical protein